LARSLNLGLNRNFGIGEARHCKCHVMIDTHNRLPPKGMCSESRDLMNFEKYIVISRKLCNQDRDMVAMED